MSVFIPADVPRSARAIYRKNHTIVSRGTDRIFLFAADHKIEHLDTDFHGPTVTPEVHNPQHLFAIANAGHVGALATQLGMIARYGPLYPEIPYLAKLNSKTNIIPRSNQDPYSEQLWTVEDVVSLDLIVPAVGITVYLGSEYEASMLKQAAQTIHHAHHYGLIGVVWMYPRGSAVANEHDPELLAGAAGVANALGADYVKIHAPADARTLPSIVEAAGTTKVLIAGGSFKEPKTLILQTKEYMAKGVAGAAIGRSIFQHSLPKAVTLTKDLSQLIYSS